MPTRFFKILICSIVLLMLVACSVVDIVGMLELPPQIIILNSEQCADCSDPNCNCDYETTDEQLIFTPETITEISADNTLTPTLSSTRSATATDLPSPTPTFTATIEPTHTSTTEPTMTATPAPKPFGLQNGSPVYTRNFYYENENCNWMGVGGQVLDGSGEWMNNMVITVQGEVDGKKYDLLGMSGAATQYGPGGYEIVISDQLFISTDQFHITLKDLSGNPLSDPYIFSTFDDCAKSLIIINFQQRVIP